MKNWIKQNLTLLIILLAPFVILPFLWEQLPAEVPIHWNARGVADDFAPKMPGMLLLPLTAIFVQLIFWVVPFIDPKRRTREFAKTIKTLQLIMAFLMLALFLIALLASLGRLENSTSYILPAVLLSFAFLGNYFSRLRPNYFIGIRTPWTLESEDNWKKTHRLGGKVWVFVSLLLLLLFPFLEADSYTIVFIIGVGIMLVIPFGYSYWLYHTGRESKT